MSDEINPCELDPILRDSVERCILVVLSKGYRFVVSFLYRIVRKWFMMLEYLAAICEEREVMLARS